MPGTLLGAGDSRVNKTNILASVAPTFKCGEETRNQIESDMAFEGTGALGRCRAVEEDLEIQGGRPSRPEGGKGAATWLCSEEFPGHRAE